MRYDNLPAFEKYLESTVPQGRSTLYFMIGKDPSENQNAVDFLLNALLPANEKREFALITLDGNQLDEGVLVNALDSGSFFAKSQVVWIQNFDKSKKAIQDILDKFITRSHGGQSLVLSATSWSKNSSFYKAVEKIGVVLDLAEVKPWEKEKRLVAWVNRQAAAARKLMSYQACQLFVKRIGNDQALLTQELEKLICYCIDKNEITERDVEAICSSEHSHTIWQLGEALFSHDSAGALRIGSTFLNEGQPFLPLLRQIRSQFQTEYQVSLLLAQGKQPEDIAQQFPYMKGQILERHIQQAKRYGLKAFKAGLLAIDQTEMRSKNSSVDEKILLELLMMQLTRRI